MKLRRCPAILAVAVVLSACTSGPGVAPAPERHPAGPADWPETRRDDIVETIHGTPVADPYRWLEKADDPAVQEWMRAQDELSRATLERLAGRDALLERFRQLVYIDSVTPPHRRGERWFSTRHHADKEKAILYVREGEEGPERVLLDPNALSPDGSTSLRGWWPSWDGRYVAYKLSRNNADVATMYVRDVAAGRDLDQDVIDGARRAQASWTPDGTGFYYTWLPTDPAIPAEDLPGHAEVRFHALGTDPRSDPVVHPALGDPTAFISSSVSRDGRWLFFSVDHGRSRTELWFKDLKAKPVATPSGGTATEKAGFRPLVTGRDAIYEVYAWRDRFYVRTSDGAPRYRLFSVDPQEPARQAWKEIVPEAKDATLEDSQVIGDHLVLRYLRNAVSEMEVRSLDGELLRKVDLPGLGTIDDVVGTPDDDEAYFSFESFTQPPQIFRTSVRSGDTDLWEAVKVPADLSRMTTEQVWYSSRDGTRVSMFLVHRKDMRRNGGNPVLLTGYGGFDQSWTPWFSEAAVVWPEHGGVFAVPNLRGGGEYGEDWHRAGMLERKQNVFDDFIAAAEYLIAEKVTRPERLAIRGASNGGLLVGAAMTQRPDLLGAVVCEVPLLDMVRYHLFGSGKTWIEEYGSADDAELFSALYAYSPYHHVRQGTAYPALLMMSADSDDRVDPMHARKFVAAVQHATTSVWLRIERNAGHAGADLRKQNVVYEADVHAFLLQQLGVRG